MSLRIYDPDRCAAQAQQMDAEIARFAALDHHDLALLAQALAALATNAESTSWIRNAAAALVAEEIP